MGKEVVLRAQPYVAAHHGLDALGNDAEILGLVNEHIHHLPAEARQIQHHVDGAYDLMKGCPLVVAWWWPGGGLVVAPLRLEGVDAKLQTNARFDKFFRGIGCV